MKKKAKPYIISVLIALFAEGISALFTMGNMDIYQTINKPFLTPPTWLFPIVWTILFTLMGIGAGLVYMSSDSKKRGALAVYAVQLAVNFVWSLIFFNVRNFSLAVVWLILLWILVLVMIIKFCKINKKAAYLQIPYLAWLTFALYLTIMISILQ